jgi:hypothetical protein
MMKSNTNISVLAKLLAVENITIVEDANAKTASFDLINRTLALPLWEGISRDMTDMLVVHETGHAIDTPVEEYPEAIEEIAEKVFGPDFNGLHKKAVSCFLNVVEDVRIDKRQKRRYPGAKHNYAKAAIELMDRDFFGLKTNKKDVSDLILIDRLNIYSKVGVRSGVVFTPEEEVLVKKAFETERFEEVKSLVEEILLACKKELEDKMEGHDDVVYTLSLDSETGNDDGDNADDNETVTLEVSIKTDSEKYDEDKVSNNPSDSEGQTSDGKSENESEGDSDSKGEGDNESSSSSNGHGDDKSVASDSIIPQSETVEAFENALKSRANPLNKIVTHCYLPTPNLDRIVEDYKVFLKDHRNNGTNKNPSDLGIWKQSEKNTVAYMVKEFEMKKAAEQYSKISTNKTGVINTNKIFSYKYNEDIFRRNTVVPQGKNHGFVMFLDWSSSMISNLHNTMKQLLSLVMFCKQIQVPFEVYLFKNGLYSNNGKPLWNNPVKDHVLMMDEGFRLRNVLSSRMTLSELNEAMGYLWSSSCGWSTVDRLHCTPLNSAIVAAEGIVNKFRDRTKVEVVNVVFLTDGDSDPVNISGEYNYHGKMIIHDEKTKERYNTESYWKGTTDSFLHILKNRTGCNLVGFFLIPDTGSNGRRKRSPFQYLSHMLPEKDRDVLTKKLENEKYVEVTSSGYDSYYLVLVSNNKNESLGDIKTKNGKISPKAFSNFMKGKIVNRAMLRKFIDNIAGNQ